MCGIVAYSGPKNACEVLLDGLKRLEYRGYDSSGIAVIKDNGIELRRSVGKLDRLVAEVNKRPVEGHIGIGHTRWATHRKALVDILTLKPERLRAFHEEPVQTTLF